MTSTPTDTARKAGGRLPPRFVIRAAWVIHRALFRVLGRRRALRPATETTCETGDRCAAIMAMSEPSLCPITMRRENRESARSHSSQSTASSTYVVKRRSDSFVAAPMLPAMPRLS